MRVIVQYSPWDLGQIGIKSGTTLAIYQKSATFLKNDILTGLKVSSLTCEWVFYRPEHNVNEGPCGTEL